MKDIIKHVGLGRMVAGVSANLFYTLWWEFPAEWLGYWAGRAVARAPAGAGPATRRHVMMLMS
jgi:hypothetical protein